MDAGYGTEILFRIILYSVAIFFSWRWIKKYEAKKKTMPKAQQDRETKLDYVVIAIVLIVVALMFIFN